ncbi:MAG: hypothetical protein HOE53_04720 [Candidatus Magasanikbacteria bacterium]|jgi:hypothetical protein|nr:hypothetical protein [Candidatus Magasanikbacteria bacterium]
MKINKRKLSQIVGEMGAVKDIFSREDTLWRHGEISGYSLQEIAKKVLGIGLKIRLLRDDFIRDYLDKEMSTKHISEIEKMVNKFNFVLSVIRTNQKLNELTPKLVSSLAKQVDDILEDHLMIFRAIENAEHERFIQSMGEIERDRSVESAANKMGKYYEDELVIIDSKIKNLEVERKKLLKYLIGVIIGAASISILVLLIVKCTGRLNYSGAACMRDVNLSNSGILQIILAAKIALLATLSWAIKFVTRSLRIWGNERSIYRHRQIVSEITEEYLSRNPVSRDDAMKNKMIDIGTNAIFDHKFSGHLGNSAKDDGGPINSIIDLLKYKK